MVTDFGIARVASERGSSSLTRSGVVMGTAPYMAPELADDVRHATASADMFSFGVLGFLMLTGRLPHAIPPVVARRAGQDNAAIKLCVLRPDLPVALAALMDGCLAEAPTSRPAAIEVATTMSQLSGRARPVSIVDAPALA